MFNCRKSCLSILSSLELSIHHSRNQYRNTGCYSLLMWTTKLFPCQIQWSLTNTQACIRSSSQYSGMDIFGQYFRSCSDTWKTLTEIFTFFSQTSFCLIILNYSIIKSKVRTICLQIVSYKNEDICVFYAIVKMV